MPPKRKPSEHQTGSNKRPRFTVFQDARAIAAQTKGSAFANGELDVDKFVKAREYEIKALEGGMRSARKSAMTRAFQCLPRDLRRRTASHNVKRVPKRLQSRAKREMIEDNTPTVSSKTRTPTGKTRLRREIAKSKSSKAKTSKAKNEEKKERTSSNPVGNIEIRLPHIKKGILSRPPRPKAKFRKRQINKTWLPTHLFHTKRAHMTPPKEPLWRMALPLSPTQKAYRPTHRAAGVRGAIAWDTSYMATIGLEGSENSLAGLLKALGVGVRPDEPNWWDSKAQRWLSGSRAWSGWLYERQCYPINAIAPVTVIWDRRKPGVGQDDRIKKAEKRQAMIRVHPSAFLQLWETVLHAAKAQNPSVKVEDMRFEIGSIEITGPASTEALLGVLKPTPQDIHVDGLHSARSIWSCLEETINPSTLPADAVMAFDVSDPRLSYPPRTVDLRSNLMQHTNMLQALVDWPLDHAAEQTTLFERSARLLASRRLPSQKSMNRRKGQAPPGAYPAPLPNDPQIPVVLLPSRPVQSGGQGLWTLLVPWKCVVPIWYCLMHYPLSQGGNVRFGGLEQKRQLCFEAGSPWFPGDFPGTAAGLEWESSEHSRRKRDWEKRPKSKRVAWENVDLGLGRRGEVGQGWSCDWDALLGAPRKENEGDAQWHQLEAHTVRGILRQSALGLPSRSALVTVQLTMLGRGVSRACARIYRLPTNNTVLRKKWVGMSRPRSDDKRAKQQRLLKPMAQTPRSEHERRMQLAGALLDGASEGQRGEANVEAPDEVDLVGFVTTGNFNLREGGGSSIGSMLLEKMQSLRTADDALCIIRDSGQSLGRLARWKIV